MRTAALFFAGLTLFAQDPSRGVNFYSIEKEKALGEQLASEYRAHATLIESPELLRRVEALGRSLVPPESKIAYTFALVDDEGLELHEPVALPGGFLFVPSGLILSAGNIDELAGMLAHAIAHIEARHGTKLATRGQIVNQATIPLIFTGGWNGYAIRRNASLAIPLGMLKTHRTMELQADSLGAELMQSQGYSAGRLADYIERVQTQDTGAPNPASPLPPRAERVAALRAFPAPSSAPQAPPDLRDMQELLRRALPDKAKTPPRLSR